MLRRSLLMAALLALFALLPLADAQAQSGSRLYLAGGHFITGGAGMSPGYRQVVALDWLTGGRSRSNLYRDGFGRLVPVLRRDGHAFLLAVPDGFPLLSFGGGWTVFPGYGYGPGKPVYAPPPGLVDSSAGAVIGGWIGLVEGGLPLRFATSGGTPTPIDSWIGQLSGLQGS